MTNDQDAEIGVIGAGIAGLTAARALADAGRKVVVFDKGRGLGGRIATRRIDGGGQFDHGAQYLLQGAVPVLEPAGLPWKVNGRTRYVGTPGMSSLVKGLAEGLTVHREVEIGSLRHRNGWSLFDTRGARVARVETLIIAIPAPQAMALAGQFDGADLALGKVKMTPGWTLLVAFDAPILPGIGEMRPEAGPFGWIVRDSGKPGRAATPDCWVAQARPSWSEAHLELERPKAARMMFDALQSDLGPLPEPMHMAAHRWRYAGTSEPLGEAFLRREGGRLLIGGDWTRGSRIEDAEASGTAMARDVLGR